jgi:hypothetical protein
MTQPIVQQPNGQPTQAGAQPDPMSPPPKLFTVALVNGEMWQLGGFVPGSETTLSRGTDPNNPATYGKEIEGTAGHQALRIVDMIPNEDASVDVYAVPVPGSEFERQQTAVIITHYPHTVQRTLTIAKFNVWQAMLEEANTPDDDDDDDDDDLEPDTGTSPAANGAPTAGQS